MKQQTHDSGFTLLEVLIAVAIIAFGFMGVYSLHLETISVSNRIQFYIKAPMLAKKKIADMESQSDEFSEESGDFGEDFAGYAWKVSEEEVELESLGTTAEKLKKFNLEIILNEGENSYSVTVYRYVVKTES